MNTQLFVPKKIKVGYQKRTDTYSGKLAYIIYYDNKNVLRKETSWQSWRDKNIPDEEYDNVPTSGFVLHKDIKRYNWSHFSSKRTMIRVFDPRGVEFEITTDNLIGILMNTDCSKRGLTGEFVYAWSGPELVLLPVDTEEYKKATEFTELQSGKIGVKNLVPGCVYRTKKQTDYIYVGRYNYYENNCPYYASETETVKETVKKVFVFKTVKEKTKEDYFYRKWHFVSSLNSFASQVTTEPVDTLNNIIDELSNEGCMNKIESYFVKPIKNFDLKEGADVIVFRKTDKGIFKYRVRSFFKETFDAGHYKNVFQGYYLSEQILIHPNNDIQIFKEDSNYYYDYYSHRVPSKIYTLQELSSLDLGDLYVKYEGGKTRKIQNTYHLHE